MPFFQWSCSRSSRWAAAFAPAIGCRNPARLLSLAIPSWAFESTVVSEAKGHVCGYLAGVPRWDGCPAGGRGVDVATLQIPEVVSGPADNPRPAQPSGGKSLRYSFWQSIAALGGMLAALLSAVLVFLKMRDIH